MFIEDIRNDFYNVLLGNRVLLLVHYDVDAICACKILQELFRCDNVSYTLVPVGGLSELKSAYEENNEEVKYVVLVNCGGTVDLVDILQPDEHVVFFVLDSHKPTDICNVYSDGQVRLLYKDEEENIPNFDDIFRDDEDQENEEELEARHGLEALVERRRARKAWEERRHTLMFNYTQFSYYGKPSTSVALELAVRASRCTAAALWCASVAAAAHAALHCRSPARCLLDAEPLHRYVAAAQRKTTDDDVHQAARVVVEKDVWLPLYRWWSVEGAISHAAALAPQLRLHTHSGAARLRQLLADMGFPLQQARQAYRSMDVELRRALLPALEAAAPRQRLPAPARAAFLLQRPHAPTLAALDVVYAIMGLIENHWVSVRRAPRARRASSTRWRRWRWAATARACSAPCCWPGPSTTSSCRRAARRRRRCGARCGWRRRRAGWAPRTRTRRARCWPARPAPTATACCSACRRASTRSPGTFSVQRLSKPRQRAAPPSPWTLWTRPSSACPSRSERSSSTRSRRCWRDRTVPGPLRDRVNYPLNLNTVRVF
ncbi:cell division control protein 45 homolog isoform X2 [Bicyclus anynana]|uniref:Cell division control protein 45 homolog isoform X2 n=1 Tax=Bicyclus anynana TaxID=110368 RepID=A0ABM3LJD5_BICAN|nr:cell division control protein 45 homolog isoform X2 [Bicyclus anynana]